MSPWRWTPERQLGIWRHGAAWMRPFLSATPAVAVLLLVVMMHCLSGTLSSADGLLLELPESGAADLAEAGDLVVLVVPQGKETIVFFDDSRYLLDDATSRRALAEHLGERLRRRKTSRTLAALADRRVSGGELVRLSELARESGVEKLLLATRREEERE